MNKIIYIYEILVFVLLVLLLVWGIFLMDPTDAMFFGLLSSYILLPINIFINTLLMLRTKKIFFIFIDATLLLYSLLLPKIVFACFWFRTTLLYSMIGIILGIIVYFVTKSIRRKNK